MIETLNNAVVLPHLPNWTDPVKLRRSWSTSVASGINGSEDRSSERTAAWRKITYKVSTLLGDGPQESEALAERLKAALQSGRAVCPLFGRAQAVAPFSYDPVRLQALGLWPWTAGEYAFLSLVSHAGINQEVLIDVGGSGEGAFQSEANFTHSGGSVHTIAGDIDITGVDEFSVPPQAVLQSCRRVAADPNHGPEIAFTVQLTTRYHVKLRLWFAFDTAGQTTCQVRVNSEPVVVIDSWEACGSALLTAGFCDVPCWPDAAGKLVITVSVPSANSTVQVNAIEVFSTCCQMIPIETVTITDVTELVFAAERIKFASLADIEQIYPVLWGKLSVGDMSAITNWHGEIEISVAEPMGDPARGILGLYQTELCGIPIDPPPPEPEPEYPVDWLGSNYLASSSAQLDSYIDAAKSILGSEFIAWVAQQHADQIEATGNVTFNYEPTGDYRYDPDETVDTHPAALGLWFKVDGEDRLFARSGGCFALSMEYSIIPVNP